MPRRRAIVPLEAEATTTRTEAESFGASCSETPVQATASSLAPVEIDPIPQTPQRTSERQRLAELIAVRDALSSAIAETSDAVATAIRADLDASTAFYAAERAFRRAQPGHQPERPPGEEALYEDWIREQSEPPLPIGEARAAMETARDAKDTARRALEFHQGNHDGLSDSLTYRRYDVERAVKAVVASDLAVAALMAEARRRFVAYQDARRLVNRLQNMDVVGRVSPSWDDQTGLSDPTTLPLTAAWGAAIEALASDPDAPLPAP